MIEKLIIKILNLKLFILLEYQNIKTFLQKGYTPNWWEEVFVIKKVKHTVPWTYVINVINEEEIVGVFYKKRIGEKKLKRI